jgi:hypothetical protein
MEKEVANFAPHLRVKLKELTPLREVGLQPRVVATYVVIQYN